MSDTPAANVRPTKKQRDLLTFIEAFIGEHGYSPSYREIMNGLQYTSVATVALHVNSLISRGHLRKREHSARSLEVVNVAAHDTSDDKPAANTDTGQAWLEAEIRKLFDRAEAAEDLDNQMIDDLKTVVRSLSIICGESAAAGFILRLETLESDTES